MLVLSVRNPWAYLLIHGPKDIENRSWKPSPKHYGTIAIQAATNKAKGFKAIRTEIEARGIPLDPEKFVFGAIIGTVELYDCVESSESEWFTGPYGLLVRNPIALPEPIPYKAKTPALHNVPIDDEIQRQLAA